MAAVTICSDFGAQGEKKKTTPIYKCVYIYTKAFLQELRKNIQKGKKREEMEKLENINLMKWEHRI